MQEESNASLLIRLLKIMILIIIISFRRYDSLVGEEVKVQSGCDHQLK